MTRGPYGGGYRRPDPDGREPGRPRGDRRGPEALGDILQRVMRDVRPPGRKRRDRMLETWVRVAGPELAEETRPATLRGGVLTVEVRSTALLHELEGFRKDELLDRLLSEDPSGRVTGLRFRLGVF